MAQSKEQTPVSKGSFKTIVLCGSTKFKKHFIALNLVLTLSNWIVLSVGSFHHIDHEIKEITMARKKQLDDLHKAKIDISDCAFFIDVDGYMGESTRSELEHARQKLEQIFYWSQDDIHKLIDPDLAPLLHSLLEKEKV